MPLCAANAMSGSFFAVLDVGYPEDAYVHKFFQNSQCITLKTVRPLPTSTKEKMKIKFFFSPTPFLK